MLVRLLTGDEPQQAARAQTVIEEDFILTGTVLLETEWVLRSRYGMSRRQRATALRMAIDLPHAVEIPDQAHWAIDRMEAGGDFADMIHLIAATGASRFTTFDRDLAAEAGPNAPLPIETLA